MAEPGAIWSGPMSENLRRYTVAVFGLDHAIRLVPPTAWDAPSPCEGWTARDVAGHAMGVVNNIAAKVGVGPKVDPFGDVGAIAGDDPAESFRIIRNRFLEALDREGVLQQTVPSSLGDGPVDGYLAALLGDTLIHTWDVARAAGVDDTLDPDLVRIVHDAMIAKEEPNMRSPGHYSDAIAADETMSAQDRLIAYTGRDPR